MELFAPKTEGNIGSISMIKIGKDDKSCIVTTQLNEWYALKSWYLKWQSETNFPSRHILTCNARVESCIHGRQLLPLVVIKLTRAFRSKKRFRRNVAWLTVENGQMKMAITAPDGKNKLLLQRDFPTLVLYPWFAVSLILKTPSSAAAAICIKILSSERKWGRKDDLIGFICTAITTNATCPKTIADFHQPRDTFPVNGKGPRSSPLTMFTCSQKYFRIINTTSYDHKS